MSDAKVLRLHDAPSEPPPRFRVGPYQLCFEIGSGGMAVVYLARNQRPGGFDKLAALKCIHPHLAREPKFVEMFFDEARIASRIDHPNVCNVFDFGQADGAYYMAMEYLMGQTLNAIIPRFRQHDELVKSGRYLPAVLRMVSDACEGLHAAHELIGDDGKLLEVVHRDISPSNLFVSYDGIVKLMDFGIARAAEKIHHTATGTLKGKVAYMAPEQMRDEDIDRRADVWSVGVVVWQLATGRRLFKRRTDPDTILAVLSATVPKAASFDKTIPAALDDVLQKALARDRRQRYATARELGRDLMQVASMLGPAMTPAELSEWMCKVFPEEHGKAVHEVRIARQLGGTHVPKVAASASSISEESTDHGVSFPDETEKRGASRKLVLPIAIGVGSLLVGLLAGAIVVLATASDDDPRQAVATIVPEPEPRAAPATADRVDPQERAPVEDAPLTHEAAPAEPRHEERARRERRPRERSVEPAMERETAAMERETGEPATITVITRGGWADVFVGARRLGRSPGRWNLPPGTHTLRLVPEGNGAPRTVQVTLGPGEGRTVAVPLQ